VCLFLHLPLHYLTTMLEMFVCGHKFVRLLISCSCST